MSLPRRLLIVPLLLIVGVAVLLTQPLDVGGTVPLPAAVVQIKQRDDVAYPGHRWLAAGLERLGYPADAVGLQWLKAAAHATTPEEVERTARGFADARRRASSTATFDASVCRYVADRTTFYRAETIAIERAGLRCQG